MPTSSFRFHRTRRKHLFYSKNTEEVAMFNKKSGGQGGDFAEYTVGVIEPQEEAPLLLEEEDNRPMTLPPSTLRRVLTVGAETLLKGDIADCDCLRIEGNAHVNVTNVHRLEVSESGIFRGSAVVEEAYIKGSVEGDITVTGKLYIHETGKLSGSITYASVEIEHGGELSGEITLYNPVSVPPKASVKENFRARSSFAERFVEEV
jgi:cytoskeletal protein CcmA (bactofilin family)